MLHRQYSKHLQQVHTPADISALNIDRQQGQSRSWLSKNFSTLVIILSCAFSVIYLMAVLFLPAKNIAKSADFTHQALTKNSLSAAAQAPLVEQLEKPPEHALTTNTGKQVGKTVLDASGHVVARRIATVSSRITGKLVKLTIEEGQQVSKAEVLAELDNQQAQITYHVSLADLLAKQADFAEIKLLFSQQQKRFQRQQLLAKQQLVSEQVLEDSQFKTEQLAIQRSNKQALVQLAEQNVALAQYQLTQHQIKAPFAGVVISKNAQIGELISAGSASGGFIRTGVATIVDMSSLEIEVEVGESYINRVFVGQQVIAKLDAYPQWAIESEVVAVIPTADRQKASIKVRVKLLETDSRILPDMSVKVSFTDQINTPHQDLPQVNLSALSRR